MSSGTTLHLKVGLQVVCVEPHPLSYSRLVELREHFFAGSVQGVHWCAAWMPSCRGGNTAGALPEMPCVAARCCPPPCFLSPPPFPCRRLIQAGVRCSPAAEGTCILAVPGAAAEADADVVPVMTVDELLAMHKLQNVDLLKVGMLGTGAAACMLAMCVELVAATACRSLYLNRSAALLPLPCVQIDADGNEVAALAGAVASMAATRDWTSSGLSHSRRPVAGVVVIREPGRADAPCP